jgi:hypothetical protein
MSLAEFVEDGRQTAAERDEKINRRTCNRIRMGMGLGAIAAGQEGGFDRSSDGATDFAHEITAGRPFSNDMRRQQHRRQLQHAHAFSPNMRARF